MSNHTLTGRTALVTGGTRGIGAAIVEALASRGAEVIVHGREDTSSTSHRYIAADLSVPDGATRLVGELQDLRQLDVLVNNAGFEVEEDSSKISTAVWNATMNVNLLAPVLLTGLLSDRLEASGRGSVINITSIHERVANPRHLAYSSSKAGLAMATRVFALELASRGIRVNSVAPGAIETDMNREIIDTVGRDRFHAAIPAGRLGHPRDIGGVVAFLAGDDSAYVTGTSVWVDGAYSEHIVRY